jgi:hypothetical protein
MPQGDTERGERLARTALIAAMALSALTILLLGRNLTFWSDELDWLTFGGDFGAGSLLTPHGSHLIATTRVVYEGLPRIFGVSYLPFRILGIVCLQACAVLVFILVRRRMGGVVAVFPAIILLFFGSAQDMFLSPLGIPFTLSIAFGLGALALVEQNQFRTDVLACLLLILSGMSHSFGTIIAGGVLVYLLVERSRRREVWIAIVPLALWIAWWVWAQQFDQGIASSGNLLGAPIFIVQAAGAAIEGILGIPVGADPIPEWMATSIRVVFDIVAIALMALLGVRLRRGGSTPWTWAYLATVFAFWFGIALSEGEGREATTPRYLYFGAIMIILIAAELKRGERIPSRFARPLVAAFAFALACNVGLMFHAVSGFNEEAANVRATIAVIGLNADDIDPATKLGELDLPGAAQVPSSVGALDEFAGEVGSTGFSLEELWGQPEDVRLGADLVLVRALQVAATPIPGSALSRRCETFNPGSDGYSNFPLGGGVSLIRLAGDTGEPGATLSIGRYASLASVPVGELTEGSAVAVLLPDDEVPDVWLGRAAGRIEVCDPVRTLSP